MATMREFKQGDKVVCVHAIDAALTQGKVYNVTGVRKYYIEATADDNKKGSFAIDRFMHERDYVEMCLQAIIDRNIVVSGVRGDIRKRWDGVWYSSAAEFVSDYYPIESPAQKELRELKEQAKELHDKIAELEDKAK